MNKPLINEIDKQHKDSESNEDILKFLIYSAYTELDNCINESMHHSNEYIQTGDTLISYDEEGKDLENESLESYIDYSLSIHTYIERLYNRYNTCKTISIVSTTVAIISSLVLLLICMLLGNYFLSV